jgi:hypothetical protein
MIITLFGFITEEHMTLKDKVVIVSSIASPMVAFLGILYALRNNSKNIKASREQELLIRQITAYKDVIKLSLAMGNHCQTIIEKIEHNLDFNTETNSIDTLTQQFMAAVSELRDDNHGNIVLQLMSDARGTYNKAKQLILDDSDKTEYITLLKTAFDKWGDAAVKSTAEIKRINHYLNRNPKNVFQRLWIILNMLPSIWRQLKKLNQEGA